MRDNVSLRSLIDASLPEIQGNIYPGLSKPVEAFVFLRFDDDFHLRVFTRRIASRLTSAKTVIEFKELYRGSYDTAPAELWMNVAFSYSGLQKLTGEAHKIKDPAFRMGMAERERVEAGGRNSKKTISANEWKVGGRVTNADLVVILAHDERVGIDLGVSLILKILPSKGKIIHVDIGSRLHEKLGNREHFGYRDGISQPLLRGFDVAKKSEVGLTPVGGWAWPGEFIFGFPESHPIKPSSPGALADGGSDWARNGSFLVFQRLNQDVEAFLRLSAEITRGLHQSGVNKSTINEAWVGSRIIGRWENGLPICNFPDRELDPKDIEGEINRHFDFASEQNLSSRDRCPYFSHIRKMNPRDERFTPHRHRILRRGIPFGDPYPDPNEKGLLFVCYQTDIPRQFEFIRHNWASGDTLGFLPGEDVIIGNMGPVQKRIYIGVNSDRPVLRLRKLISRPLVTLTGGDYYFCPSLSALTNF